MFVKFVFLVGLAGVYGQMVQQQQQMPYPQQQGPPLPPFLYGADRLTIQSFGQLVSTFNGLPEADIERKVNNWIMQQSPEIRARYTLFRSEELSRKRWRENEQAEMASRLSPQAQAAERRFTAIDHDPHLSPQQKFQQIQQIKSTLPKNIIAEIDGMFEQQMHQHQEGREQYHKSIISQLSPAAQAADARIQAIDRDPMTPPQQKMQKIQMILTNLPKVVKDELENAFRRQ